MPKLSWKERQNLYEAVRMDSQERAEWESLEVKVTPNVQGRLEDFRGALEFVEAECRPDIGPAFEPHGGIYHQDEIQKNTRQQRAMAEKMVICVKCGHWTPRKSSKKKNKLAYCGYCYAVCFGDRDDRWLPKISRGDNTKGMHRA